jgi:hypothetical protein
MTRNEFEHDDRFCTLDSSDLGCHGGNGPRDVQVAEAVAWMLDPKNSTAFCAVLDPGDEQVATLDGDGNVVWEPLAEFDGNV